MEFITSKRITTFTVNQKQSEPSRRKTHL